MPQPSFDATAAAYDRRVGRWSRLYIPALVEAARIMPGDRVLDVATGTGEAAIAGAAAAGPSGRVIASDISLPMLLAAKRKVPDGPVAVVAMNGQGLACRDESVDALICQLGLMFFPDVGRGLQEFRRVLRVGRWMAACVWSAPERAPFVSVFSDTMVRHVPAKREEILAWTSLADTDRLHRLLTGAGFRDVSITPETRPISFDSFEEYWEPIEAGGSSTAALYKDLPEALRDTVREEVRARMKRYESGGRLLLNSETLLAAGKK